MTLDEKKDLTPGNVTFECTWYEKWALCWYFSYSLKKYAGNKVRRLELKNVLEKVLKHTYYSMFCEIGIFLEQVKPFDVDVKNGFKDIFIRVNFIYYF